MLECFFDYTWPLQSFTAQSSTFLFDIILIYYNAKPNFFTRFQWSFLAPLVWLCQSRARRPRLLLSLPVWARSERQPMSYLQKNVSPNRINYDWSKRDHFKHFLKKGVILAFKEYFFVLWSASVQYVSHMSKVALTNFQYGATLIVNNLADLLFCKEKSLTFYCIMCNKKNNFRFFYIENGVWWHL